MKVLQLIDSLHTGGAERMAVNIANSLTSNMDASYLCATREEGLLKQSLSAGVQYLFLNKQATIDFKAIKKLHGFIKRNGIAIIHAHSSSFFLGTLMKMLNPKLILIWHDHYGNSEYLEHRSKFVLKISSLFFNHVITVNTKLQLWNEENLHIKSVSYLPNFTTYQNVRPNTILEGNEGTRIICLANFRPQKDHINLLKAFSIVKMTYPDWTLHLVGQDFNDSYSQSIKDFIKEKSLEKQVFIYGSCTDVFHILSQCSIGVLSSKSEGLPVALLEYGAASLPVVATQVGDCQQVIYSKEEGLLVEPQNPNVLAEALLTYMNDLALRTKVAKNLQTKVVSSFSESSIIESLISIYKTQKK